MKKFLVMLLVCILVFSITVSLTSCWWRNSGDEIEEEEKEEKPGTETPDDPTNSDDGTMKDGTIVLPPRPVESNQPEE